jgi:hypothetical protein
LAFAVARKLEQALADEFHPAAVEERPIDTTVSSTAQPL